MKEKQYLKQFNIIDYLRITVGVLIYSLGLYGFIYYNKAVTGGLAGISIIIDRATGIPLSYSYFGINFVLFIMAMKFMGKQFLIKTTYGVLVMTLFLWLVQKYIPMNLLPSADPLLSCIIGAVLCGSGLGLVYSSNGTTGGTDIIAFIVTKYKQVSIGRILLLVDVIVICSAYFVLPEDKGGHHIDMVIKGFIIQAVTYSVSDAVINGARQSVQFFIFSKKYDEIASHISSELHRGCTVIDGTGWYSKQPQKVLVVLARQRESSSIFKLVKTIDNEAFISQSRVVGVYGKGFDKIK